ncbi:MAG: fibronectin type III-like domain-contianing protein [Bacteroides sp.]|nr:fibronectin type III-like domain-contianing protein [Bacteroides sp.]
MYVGKKGDNYRVEVEVKNVGDREGDEVVQLYVSNKNDKFRTPIRSLKGFKRISLAPNESHRVCFELTPDDLTLIDPNGYSVPMKGELIVSVGGGQPLAGVAHCTKNINLK